MNTLDLFRLDGRTAIVTGGGRGLGRYMAEAISDAGANVVLCSRKEPLEEVRGEIEARGGRALALSCDVTEQEDVERVVAAAHETFGSVDVLVNNSGATWGAPPDEMPPEKFDRVIAVNARDVPHVPDGRAAHDRREAEARSSTSPQWLPSSAAIRTTCRRSAITLRRAPSSR